MSAIPENEIKLRDRLRVEQAQWLKLWHDCAAFCMPHKAQTIRSSQAAQIAAPSWNPQRQNSVAIDSLNVLSGGCRSWITPGGGEGWGGVWEPHPYLEKNAKVKDWLADCTLRSGAVLEAGNFFTGGHELYSDLGVFGTTGLFIDEGDETPLACHTKPPSEFVFMRGWNGEVTRVIFTYMRPAQQLVDRFGRENVPPKVAADIEAQKPDELHEVIHSIYRRSDEEMKAEYGDDPQGMRFASCWLHVADKKVMKESGYAEMPMVIPRWLTWSDSSVYGTSPAMQALADIRGVNLTDMLTATLAELQINPRVKTKPGQSGAIDLSPGGVTQESVEGGVTEWATQGRLAEGEAFTARKEQQIRRAFHADLFEQIAPVIQKRELTNYVAQALERESVGRISPAMGRLSSDFINPAMRRIFMVLYRADVFDNPPDEAFYTDQAGRRYLLYPRTVQTNRMAQALNSRKSWAFNNAMTRIAPIAAAKPEVLDIYDFETIARDLDRGDGMPPDWHLDEDAVRKLRDARAAQQQAAMAQNVAAEAIAKKPVEIAQLMGAAA
jgi:hypothetical protein